MPWYLRADGLAAAPRAAGRCVRGQGATAGQASEDAATVVGVLPPLSASDVSYAQLHPRACPNISRQPIENRDLQESWTASDRTPSEEGDALQSRAVVSLMVWLLVSVQGTAYAATSPDPLRDQQWYLDAIRSPGSAGARATGVLVAVLDSGVDADHPDLRGAIQVGPDFNSGSPGVDLNGHGTNVAGIIAAIGDNGTGIEGAAPGATVLSLRVLDAQGQGNTLQVAKGIDAAVAAGARVINISLSPGAQLAQTMDITDPVVPAMRRAVAAGVVIVAAAGNFTLPLCAQPLIVTGILCVGAVNREVRLTDYSDFGLRVDVVAPGGDDLNPIVSTAPGNRYGAMAGTSQAAPQASALAARLIAQGLTGQEVIARIKATARDLGAPGEDPQFGRGLIDMSAATGVAVPAGSAAVAPPVTPRTREASLTLTIPSPIPREGLRSRGIIVVCQSTSAGRCSVELRSGNVVLARGTRSVLADTRTNIRVRLTGRGRHIIRSRKVPRVTVIARGPRGSTATTTAVVSV